MWFWMNKVIRIGTNKGTLLIWILNYCCLDHNDVTWDGSKGESYREQGGKEDETGWRTPNSLKDSNVSPSERQRKREELGHVP
jgi:hypothetical protein